MTDFQNALSPVITSSAKLTEPDKLPFRVIQKHFFSDFDGRARYALMGTPGGDLGEFFLAMDTIEKVMPQSSGKLSFEEILLHLEDYLAMMPYDGKQYFFFQSDDEAMRNWEVDAEVSSAAIPASPAEKSRLLETISNPKNIGSRYFKLLALRPELFKTNIALVSNVLRAFFTVYFDTRHPSRPRLLFAIMEGKHDESGIVIVDRSRNYPCNDLTPLIVPNNGQKSMLVYHRAAAEIHRASMSEWLSGRISNLDTDTERIYIQLNYQARENFDALRSYYYSNLLRCQLAFAPMNEPIISSK